VTCRPNMTVAEVAELLGISRSSVYDGVNRGDIPHLRVGKRVIFPRVALVEWHRTCAGGVPLPDTTRGHERAQEA
jgi:excisionase family DNA binding protein